MMELRQIYGRHRYVGVSIVRHQFIGPKSGTFSCGNTYMIFSDPLFKLKMY